MIRAAGLVLALLAAGALGGAEAEPPKPPPGTGMPCSGDRSCPGYLRCEERACAVPPAITGQVRADTPRVVFDLGDGSTATVRLEICDEPFERQRGMMFRNRFATGWGMLFLFDTEEVHRFWMKNTYLSLDMVFLGADGKVRGIVQGAKPLDLTGRGIREPSLDVLELPSGEARKLGIRRGTPYRYLAVVRPGPTGR